jgi:hypothetical protein
LVTAADWSGGSAVRLEAQQFIVRTDGWSELRVPRTSVVAIVFAHRDHWRDREKLLEAVRQLPDKQDVILLTNHDRVSGKVDALAGGSLTLRVDRQATRIPLSRVEAVVLAADSSRSAASEPPRLAVGMRDGSLLIASTIRNEESGLALTLASGESLTGGSAEDVVFLQGLDRNRFVYLSDLAPSDYRHVPYLKLEWPYQRDRNVLGGPLTVDGKLYWKGLGIHSAARLTFPLNAEYRRFDAVAAVDDSAKGRGSVKFGVYLLRQGEWNQAATSETVRGGQPPHRFSVDVVGAEGITLTVDFEDRGDELDYANWLDARLIKN